MEKPCQNIPIAAGLLKERMKAIGFQDIFIEDDDPGLKNLFGKLRKR